MQENEKGIRIFDTERTIIGMDFAVERFAWNNKKKYLMMQ